MLFNLVNDVTLPYNEEDSVSVNNFWKAIETTINNKIKEHAEYFNRIFCGNAPISMRISIAIGGVKIYQDERWEYITTPFSFSGLKYECLPYDLESYCKAATVGELYNSIALGDVNPSMIHPKSWDYIMKTATDEQISLLDSAKEALLIAAEVKVDGILPSNKPYFEFRNIKEYKGEQLFVDNLVLSSNVSKYIEDVLDYYRCTANDTITVCTSTYGKDNEKVYDLRDKNDTINHICSDVYSYLMDSKIRKPDTPKSDFLSAINKMRGE